MGGADLVHHPFNSANDYVLSLNVGCQSGLPASQYRIELWAGGTGLGSIDQTQVAEVPGSFTQVTLQVNGGAFASQDGQWFGLWMIGNSGKTYFDNIQLMSYDRNAEVGTAATMTIDITPVNDAPTDLSLSANTVAENAANGTVVGTVNGTDPDSGDTKAYSLTDNAGGRFAINSVTGQITVANSSLLNYEVATSHNVTVRVTDSGGLTYDETFTINLTDVNEATPTITSNGGGDRINQCCGKYHCGHDREGYRRRYEADAHLFDQRRGRRHEICDQHQHGRIEFCRCAQL